MDPMQFEAVVADIGRGRWIVAIGLAEWTRERDSGVRVESVDETVTNEYISYDMDTLRAIAIDLKRD